MKRIIFILGLLLTCIQVTFSQQKIYKENFDESTITFTQSPSDSWVVNDIYATSAPNSYRGHVPLSPRDSSILLTLPYPFEGYTNMQLRFKHICKISPLDITRIEYREANLSGQWKTIPWQNYEGSASNYATTGFNSASYSDWQAKDSLAIPAVSWWKEEIFDLSGLLNEGTFEFRFILKHGSNIGTQISYGWLIDDFQIIADGEEIFLPKVEFIAPLVQDTVYTTGPFDITARVESTSSVALQTPIYLKYKITEKGIETIDSVQMANVVGNNVWRATIPQTDLYAKVDYSITAVDLSGNSSTAVSGYFVNMEKPYGDNSVALVSIDNPTQNSLLSGQTNSIDVTIQSKGVLNLDSAYIHWSVNRVEGTPHKWEGNLSWNFTERASIGSFPSTLDGFDTLKVWVSLPNGVTDFITSDDTITTIFYGCQSGFSNTYIIGNTGKFSSIEQGMNALRLCGMDDDVEFQIEDGIYTENVDLTGLDAVIGNYNFKITSFTSNKDNVIIRPASGVGVRIGGTSNLTMEHLTIDARTGSHGVQFSSACTNVIINNCNLLVDSTSNTTGNIAIYKIASTGINKDIQITNNIIKGGGHGILYNGGTSSVYGDNVLIENNIVSDQSITGISLYYTNNLNISQNTILTKDTNRFMSNLWRGIFVNSVNGKIDGNRIRQIVPNVNTTSGIYAINMNNSYGLTTSGIISNNEIILSPAGDFSGIQIETGVKANIINNSVFMGGTGVNKALRVADNVNNVLSVRNNNLAINSSTGFPVYLVGVNYLTQWDIDYNNYFNFNSTNIGYAGEAKTLEAWQEVVTADLHSVNIEPAFNDNTVDLQLTDYSELKCPVINTVNVDILGVPRVGQTSMGCYGDVFLETNAALTQILYNHDIKTPGIADTVRVVLTNGGTNPLASVTINWMFNGQAQTQEVWTKSLQRGESDTITLRPFPVNYQVGDNTVDVWLTMPGDEYTQDDTISYNKFTCVAPISGTKTIGDGGDYATIAIALDALQTCGIDAPVILALLDGEYRETVNFSKVSGLSATNTITLTSHSGDRDKVILRPSTNVGIILGDMENLIIRDITIESKVQNTTLIQFVYSCTNIVIDNCVILGAPSNTSAATYSPIYKANETGILENIRITNNIIEGDVSAISLHAGISSAWGTNITIDSNIISTTRHSSGIGVTLNNVDLLRFSYNTILSPVLASSYSWTGISLSSISGIVNANKIMQRSGIGDIATFRGISLNNISTNDTTNLSVISNNEIIIPSYFKAPASSSDGTSGIYVNSNVYASIVHNSVLIEGNGIGYTRALQVQNSKNELIIKNNNFVVLSPSGYPAYFTGTTYSHRLDIDYNNYYSADNYIGYVTNAGETSWNAWLGHFPTDIHSTQAMPDFMDKRVDLSLKTNDNIACPLLTDIQTDINNIQRTAITTMGAYHIAQSDLDIAPYTFTSIPETASIGDSISVYLLIKNRGQDTLESAEVHWSINGVDQQRYDWDGTLAGNTLSDTLFLGGYRLNTEGETKFIAWTSNPNNATDGNPNNDTLLASTIACTNPLQARTYTVGKNNSDFSSLESVVQALKTCGIDGAVVFSIEQGQYGSLELGAVQGASSVNTITFTSATGTADDVVLENIVFNAAHDITIEKVKVNPVSTPIAIELKSNVENIAIVDCSISLNLNASDTSRAGSFGIRKNSTDKINNIRITGNHIDGGYSGINITGGTTTDYGTTVFIDSNIIENQFLYGINLTNTDAVTISHNEILGRKSASDRWYGIDLNRVNANILANRIWQRGDVRYPEVITVQYLNTTENALRGLIANNEISTSKSGTYNWANQMYGAINVSSPANVDFYFNSIFVGGKGGASGLYLANSNTINVKIKYNNFIANDSCFPISLGSGGAIYELGFNNYYSKPFIGYIGSTNSQKTSLEAWNAALRAGQTDNSVSVRPHFIDSTQSLELSDYTGLEIDIVSGFTTDINGNLRAGQTAVGCYTRPQYQVEALLTEVVDWTEFQTPGNKETIEVVLQNAGATPITNAIIGWSFNDVQQAPVPWSGTLQTGESVVITLDEVEYDEQWNNLVIWIDEIKNASTVLTDDYPKDDTLSVSAYGCTLLDGPYTVGTPTSYFKTIKDAVKVVYTCGIDGPVTLRIEPGHYFESIDLSEPVPGSSATNTLTFTSSTGDADDVRIQRVGEPSTDDASFMLSNISNIKLSKLSLDGRSIHEGAYDFTKAVILGDKCDNIEISDCKLTIVPNFGSAVTGTGLSAIFKTNVGKITNIRILNNIIEGGAYGIYLHAPSTANNGNTNILIKGNTIRTVDAYGIYTRYSDLVQIEQNTIIQNNRGATASGGFYGISVNNGTGDILKNKIRAYRLYYGIHTASFGSTTDSALIANNEVIATNIEAAQRAGIYIGTSTIAKILHNSVYVSGTAAGYGISIANSSATKLEIKNNNFITATSGVALTNYPIYIANAANITGSDINNNNYYNMTDGNIGYAAADKETLGDWKSSVASDSNSTNSNPYFADLDIDLSLTTQDGLSCLQHPYVLTDMDDVARPLGTTMGAYHLDSLRVDIIPYVVYSSNETANVSTADSVLFAFRNAGANVITKAKIHWTKDGVAGTVYDWIGNLAPGMVSDTVKLGDITITSKENNIVVWTSMPNDELDHRTVNDTIKTMIYGCDSALNGYYTVGAGGNYLTIESALRGLDICGMQGAVTMALQDGIYKQNVELSNAISDLSETNTLTFTSVSQDSSKVTIQRVGYPTHDNAAFTLNNVSHVRLTHLGFDARIENVTASEYSYAKALALKGECTDVEISNCHFISPLDNTITRTAVEYSTIHFRSGQNVYNLRIKNNYIEGGAYGIYVYGAGGSNRSRNVLVENNTLVSIEKSAVYMNCVNSILTQGNFISQRTHENRVDFYGVEYRFASGDVIGNRIQSDSLYNGIAFNTVTYGALIANNEIIVQKGRSAQAAIVSTTGHVINNSVLVHKGLYRALQPALSSSSSTASIIRNNILVTLDPDTISYPIYLGSTSTANLALHDIDYNNYYSPRCIGYAVGGVREFMNDWTSVVTNDIHSKNIYPDFVNFANNLQIINYSDYDCPALAEVRTDILGDVRIGQTTMGAYNYLAPITFDAGLLEIIDVEYGKNFTEEQIEPKVVFENAGSTTLLTDVDIAWTLNGQAQTPFTWSYSSAPLGMFETDTIPFPVTTLTQGGENTIKAWITDVNNTGLDQVRKNDTVSILFYVCDSALSGDYIVGTTGDFASLNNMFETIDLCGIKGDITLKYQNGIHQENWVLTNLSDRMDNYTLKITSLTGEKDSVILRPASGAAVTLNRTNNFILDGIIIDNSHLAAHAIQFTQTCTNIVITNCNILSDPTTTSNTVSSINKATSTGVLKDVLIANNNIQCGHSGILLTGGTSTAKGHNVIVRDNIVTNVYYRGIYLQYADSVNISHNNVSFRATSSSGNGIEIDNGYGPIYGNKIVNRGTSAINYGIRLSSYNANNINGLVANNEIYARMGTSSHGAFFTYVSTSATTNAEIINNSVFAFGGTGAVKALYLAGNASSNIVVKNNHFVVSNPITNSTQISGAYPIWINTTPSTFASLDIDYNNYYGFNGANLGYVTGATPTARPDLVSLQDAIIGNNLNSKNTMPKYIDTLVSLEPSNYEGLQCLMYPTVTEDILGTPRLSLTTMGAYYGLGIQEVYDLELTAIVEPSQTTTLCAPDYVPVKFEIRNAGTVSHDFSQDTVNLYLQVINSAGELSLDTVVTIKNGALNAYQSDTFELKDLLDVSIAGSYSISGWIENSRDTVPANDTILNYIYRNTKIALPFDDDFSTDDFTGLTRQALLGSTLWGVEQGMGIDSIIAPYYGTGKLVFRGGRGSMTKISTGQLELNRTVQPVLEFWYEHDDNKINDSERDYMDVVVSYDGGKTESLLLRVFRYNAAYTTPIWERYVIDLSDFQDSSCVVVSFVAFSFGGVQQMDRIIISSNQDLSVSKIIAPDYDICNLDGKKIKVVVTNETGQNIDFDKDENNTELCVMIYQGENVIDSTVYPLEGLLEGLDSDTIDVTSTIDLVKGQNRVKAYLTNPIDNNYMNDILTGTIAITPKFAIDIQTISVDADGKRTTVGFKNEQFVILENIGNMDLPEMELVLSVNIPDEAPHFTITKVTDRKLLSGDTMHIYFDSAYTVPNSSTYEVTVHGSLLCDPVLVDTTDSKQEYVDMNDLELVSIDEPENGETIDVALSQLEVSVTITNKNIGKSYDPGEARVGFKITDIDGNQKALIPSEELPKIDSEETIPYTFRTKYTVPELEEYYLIVYIEKIDEYNQNDTLTMLRKTDYDVSISNVNKISLTMEQNIPNPAKGNTIINYSIPQDGEIVFQLYGVNGQLLYSQKENATSGDHWIELNISDYASGIYFYTMEYKGQRLTKRMSITR
jgi:parallel beta-helix repeat protein